ncbi:succinate dehydrogenase, cytochrome b556 subunit [Sphingomicrobium astaxanthinifaciens]|uniref:succinate dehydrogenase, cytochrome b556 subunit n=1 Tax=Sphingomicrobium astaxanthinifaciens TaxID=1227949 RepID=UPI001FCAB06A|nr:succinate dehydrogenase, cytochrome b556 subunit [Sphingomicrobium astaxanthinifaciens]MCJ7421507.1 succinate dehydrogenase, cytochrome b556 subunit [Sphingomicrobium astaxanthinifaciens]
MNAPSSRPLSPHLSIYRWQPHMLVSILHRITGAGLTTVGLAVLAWWLVALASGAEAYAAFEGAMGSLPGQLVLVGLSWAFFQHLFSGLRHLVLDMGAGYELKVNRFWAVMTIAASVFATALLWAVLKGVI